MQVGFTSERKKEKKSILQILFKQEIVKLMLLLTKTDIRETVYFSFMWQTKILFHFKNMVSFILCSNNRRKNTVQSNLQSNCLQLKVSIKKIKILGKGCSADISL